LLADTKMRRERWTGPRGLTRLRIGSEISKLRFAGFLLSSKHLRSALLFLAVAGLLLGPRPAGSAAPESFVYCSKQGGGAKVFAGREDVNGNLTFGISVWSPDGQNISVFGVATRHGAGWQYTDSLQAGSAVERCRLDITRGAGRAFRVVADPNATCESYGGVGAEIGTVRFPPTAYEGIVSTELDGPEAFQRAGRCISAQK